MSETSHEITQVIISDQDEYFIDMSNNNWAGF